jgi:hypothetical protein
MCLFGSVCGGKNLHPYRKWTNIPRSYRRQAEIKCGQYVARIIIYSMSRNAPSNIFYIMHTSKIPALTFDVKYIPPKIQQRPK